MQKKLIFDFSWLKTYVQVIFKENYIYICRTNLIIKIYHINIIKISITHGKIENTE